MAWPIAKGAGDAKGLPSAPRALTVSNMKLLHHTLIAGAAIFGLPFATAQGAVNPAQPPNLVVFISDDHGFLDSAPAGSPDLRTENLARLAREGMTFSHAYAASPTCAPSRAALLTGLMPIRNGAMLNHQPPRHDVKKLPAYLHELGYEVVAIGKVAHYKQGKDYGFDLVSHDTFHDDECISAAVKFLDDRTSEKPLCLLVGTNWPHVPWPEADKEADLAKLTLPPTHVDTPQTRAWRARYYAAVEKFDADLGRVYDAARRALGEETAFIHFSDHGAQWPLGKWNLYDAGSRVPMFVVWPGVVDPGSQCDAMVSLIDVLPTLVELAGGEPPEDVDGRSFAAALRGEEFAGREFVFTTHSGDGRMNEYPQRGVRTARWNYIRNLSPDAEHHTHIDRGSKPDGNSYWHSWVERAKTDPDAKAKVERYFHRPAEELYDLQNDPHEQRNLVDDPAAAATLAKLRAELDRQMAELGDEGLASEAEAAQAFKELQEQAK